MCIYLRGEMPIFRGDNALRSGFLCTDGTTSLSGLCSWSIGSESCGSGCPFTGGAARLGRLLPETCGVLAVLLAGLLVVLLADLFADLFVDDFDDRAAAALGVVPRR